MWFYGAVRRCWMQQWNTGDVLLGFVDAPAFFAFLSLGICTPSTGRPLTYKSGYSALCMRSASVGALVFLCPLPAGAVALATGAVSTSISRFSEMASAACVLAYRWHRSVRMARRGAAALVRDIAADIAAAGCASVGVSWSPGLLGFRYLGLVSRRRSKRGRFGHRQSSTSECHYCITCPLRPFVRITSL